MSLKLPAAVGSVRDEETAYKVKPRRKMNRKWIRVTVYVPTPLHQVLLDACARTGFTQHGIMMQGFAMWMARHGEKPITNGEVS